MLVNPIFIAMQQPEVLVVDYDPTWKNHFEEIKSKLLPNLESYDIDIQHVGSTSVPGLAAKPVIDIDIIALDASQIPAILEAILSLGYTHLGDLGIKGREAFKKIDLPNETPWFRHNLYLGFKDAPSIQNHLKLKAFLLANPDVAKAYGDLKKELA